jgi:GNAT superfamily N-acetyltransferase
MSTQGFWSNNPFAPTWRGALQLQWESSGGGDANGLCVKGCGVNILFHDISKEIRIHEAVQEEAEELAEFLQKWYRNTPRARCVVRAEWIRGCVAGKQSADYSAQKPWNHCLLARCARTHKLIGSIVQWNAGWLRMRDGTHWAGARCIDYLCVAGGWRSRGVARELLYAIHACAAQDAAAAGARIPSSSILS